jgi:hypothetical protein
MTYSSKVKAKRNIQRKFAGSPVIMHNHPVFRSLAPVPPVPAAVPNLSINPIAAVAPVPPVAPVAPPAPPPPPSGPTTYQQYVTIDGKSYYTDGPGGAPLAEGWMRVCDGTDVWYAHHGGEVSWEAKYYGSSV